MAGGLVDLTNFNPWEQQLRAQREANRTRQAALQGALSNLNGMLAASNARRERLRAENEAFRDREYALISESTNALVQPQTGSKVTDVKLQELGRKMKTEYYDAVKVYQDSDKGDEARQAFETAKQKALQSARVVSGSIDKLDAQVELFRKAATDNLISDGTDPAIRDFMNDLQDKELDPNQYQIVPDEKTGQLRYVGKTTGGYDVNFSLDDIANGENGFSPLAKPDMAKTVQNLMKGVAQTKKQVENQWGIAEVTDWEAMGQALDGRIDELLKDDKMFKSIAAEEGFGHAAFVALQNGEPYVATKWNPETGQEEEYEYTNLDEMKEEVKRDIMAKVEKITPHEEKQLTDNRPSLVDQQQAQQAEQVAASTSQSLVQAVGTKQPDAFNQFLGQKAMVNGFDGNIASIDILKGNKVSLTVRKGQNGEVKEFDLNNPDQLALFQSIITGQDYNLIKQANINSIINNTLLE